MELKGLKIKLYPTKEQEAYLRKLMGSCRFVYNHCLSHKQNVYESEGKTLNLKELSSYLSNDLRVEYDWLQEHNTKVFKASIIDMLDGYKRFLKGQNAFPNFKTKHDYEAKCTFPFEAISSKNDFNSNRITLTSELKNIRFRTSKEYKNELVRLQDTLKNKTEKRDNSQEGIRSATLTMTKSGDFFLSVLVLTNNYKKNYKETNKCVGVDLGIKDFVITSDGQKYENLKLKRVNDKKIKREHKRLSKKQKKSKNFQKQRIRLAKTYQKITNKKENYLHLVANQLLNENQVIVLEDLNVKGMMKNRKLSKSIQEVSIGRFIEILKYKTKWNERVLIQIDRWFPSSKRCSGCGEKNSLLKLSEREWVCPHCGLIHDRDINAAMNILIEGLRIYLEIGYRISDLKLVDSPLMDDRDLIYLKSYERLKQEVENYLNKIVYV